MKYKCREFVILIAVILVLILIGSAGSQIPQPVDGWPFNTPSSNWSFYCAPLIASDSIGSSSLSVFFANAQKNIYKFHIDGLPCENWPFTYNDTVLMGGSNPIIVDIDHDSQFEIFKTGVIRTSYHYPSAFLFAFLVLVDHDGTIMPGFPWLYTNGFGGINVADFNDDGEYEIMASVPQSGLLFCFDRYGNTLDGWPIDLPTDVMEALPRSYCVGDLDLDGANELIIAGLNHIYAIRLDGLTLSGFPIAIEDTSYYYCSSGAQPALADIDNDSYLEIITSASQWHPDFTYNSEIFIYKHTGEVMTPWPLELPNKYVNQNPIPADINGDGNIEIGFQAGSQFYFVDINKNSLPGWPRTFYRPDGQIRDSFIDWIIADLNGDGQCEIFTDYNASFADSIVGDTTQYFSYSWLFGIDYQGNNLPDYPIRVGGSYFRRPPEFGYDKNLHRLYMGISTETYHSESGHEISFELYQFSDSTGPADQWPMLSHDLLMTRNYNFVDNAAVRIADDKPRLPQSFCVRQNYPNPFNSSTIIQYDLPFKSTVDIKIYNILGQSIETLAKEIQPPGYYSIRWNAGNYPSGVYYCQIEAGNFSVSRKMVLLK